MIRTSALRLASQAPALRATSTRRTQSAIVRSRQPISARPQRLTIRSFANAAAPPPPPPPAAAHSGGGGGGNNTGMFIVLGALAALGVGGYFYLKPIVDVAQATNQTIQTAKQGAAQGSDLISALAQTALPAPVFAIYNHLASQEGGINGFLSSLKDKDIQGVLDQVKQHGGDDVKRIVKKVEKRVKDAKGKVQDVDWKDLAQELKKELPASSQKYIDMFIGQIPSKDDYDQFVSKLKKAGEEKKKDLEAAANKVIKEIEKAKKDGKSTADAYLKGLKNAAPADVDGLISQLKDAAKSAGLPADQIESWLKTKAEDGKVDAEELAKQLESKLKTAAKFLPGEPKDIVAQVKSFSPSLAELLAQALKQADIVDDNLNRKK